MESAAHRAHRSSQDIQLVAVSKFVSAERVRAAVDAGHRRFGENRVQEGLDKMAAIGADRGVDWHLIGHLQSNKARRAAAFAWIESVDSVDLVERLDRAGVEAGTRPRVLIQVDLADEATKHGTPPSGLRAVVAAALAGRSVVLSGLMIVPPIPMAAEDSRPWFRRLRELRDQLVDEGAPADRVRELSMGMSQDFEVAIEEGATLIRVGTAIFGPRA
jgi:pyridoxal phosphate enzyme (YggS family)